MRFLRDFYFADWRLFEVRGNKLLRSDLLKFPLETNFCGFLFKQRDINKEGNVIFSTFNTFLGKTTVYSFPNEKCGILEALENGVPSDDPFEQV